jgi:hypothetical protein
MLKLALATVCFVLALNTAASAQTRVQLAGVPAGAVRIPAKQIFDLYNGRTYAFESYAERQPIVGFVRFDLRNGRNVGRWRQAKKTGNFSGRVRFIKDLICYKLQGENNETCNAVFVTRSEIFEVNDRRRVDTVLFRE